MTDPLGPLDLAIDRMVEQLTPSAKKALGFRIATDLRAANAGRMRANEQPDGTPMEPRKARRRKRGKLRPRKMFLRAAGARYLRKQSSAGEAQVGFAGAMARIMRVHQLGLRDTVTRDPASPEAQYAAREVIGINAADRGRVLETIADRLAD